MNQTKVAGLDIDMIDICVENLRNGETVELIQCDDVAELKQYLMDEDVLVSIVSDNNKIVLTPLFILNSN